MRLAGEPGAFSFPLPPHRGHDHAPGRAIKARTTFAPTRGGAAAARVVHSHEVGGSSPPRAMHARPLVASDGPPRLTRPPPGRVVGDLGSRKQSRVLPGPQTITGRRSPTFHQFLCKFLVHQTGQQCNARATLRATAWSTGSPPARVRDHRLDPARVRDHRLGPVPGRDHSQAPSRASEPGLPLSRASGRRLAALLSLSEPRLRAAFELVNLLPSWPGRVAVLLGGNVAAAFRHRGPPLTWRWAGGAPCLRFPHPSGVNRWWNDAGNARAARRVLRRLLAVSFGGGPPLPTPRP